MAKRLPDFIVAGAAKCGSTSLHFYLGDHPDIFMPLQKEIHFFTAEKLKSLNVGPKDDRVNAFHISNYTDYINQFKRANDSQKIGEVSPSYFNYPELSIPGIKDEIGNPKIIFILRDPIKRAYSNYLHLIREERETLSFYEALQEEDKRKEKKYSDFWYYRYHSTYYDKVKKFEKAFEQLLIITTEELKEDTIATMQKVYDFIGVASDHIPSNIDVQYNSGGVYESNPITKFFFRQSKLRSFIKRLIPITDGLKKTKQKIIKKYKRETPPIDPRAEEFLINYLKNDVQQLNNDFNINIKNWNDRLIQKNE